MHQHISIAETQKSRRLLFAVLVNLILVAVQIIWGLFSNSLALLADALHNLSDAGTIVIALIVRRIAQRPATNTHTYGYRRAEILGALVNCSSLVFVGIYLLYQAGYRYFYPTPVEGLTIIWVALIALIVDSLTAFFTYRAGGDKNLNIRAAFLHNLADAFASIAVVIAGICILLFQWYIVDLIATIAISLYILVQGFTMIRKSIIILMQAVPEHIDLDAVQQSIAAMPAVTEIRTMHIWQLDDDRVYLTASIELTKDCDAHSVRRTIKQQLIERYAIFNSLLELH